MLRPYHVCQYLLELNFLTFHFLTAKLSDLQVALLATWAVMISLIDWLSDPVIGQFAGWQSDLLPDCHCDGVSGL